LSGLKPLLASTYNTLFYLGLNIQKNNKTHSYVRLLILELFCLYSLHILSIYYFFFQLLPLNNCFPILNNSLIILLFRTSLAVPMLSLIFYLGSYILFPFTKSFCFKVLISLLCRHIFSDKLFIPHSKKVFFFTGHFKCIFILHLLCSCSRTTSRSRTRHYGRRSGFLKRNYYTVRPSFQT
jgi:hypothetical protein